MCVCEGVFVVRVTLLHNKPLSHAGVYTIFGLAFVCSKVNGKFHDFSLIIKGVFKYLKGEQVTLIREIINSHNFVKQG